jgi:hypothetical protein
MARFEYGYTDITDPANPIPMLFGLNGVSDDVAKAVRTALTKVTTITNVTAEKITENRANVT